jgi:myo-inositol-1-phosphate synthase
MEIRIAIIGVGNCASSLYQGIHYYDTETTATTTATAGLMRDDIGGYKAKHIRVVAAYDVDRRKVGQCFKTAAQQRPNCTPWYVSVDAVRDGPIVRMGNVLDGVSPVMATYPDNERFLVDEASSQPTLEEVVAHLTEERVDILINYLPVGSQLATEFYAECCLQAGVHLCNCIPVFIASDPAWEARFKAHGLALIGDDMKSQFGASILSQMLEELALSRGHRVKCHIQRNVGGNTDFLNMTDKARLVSKRTSKENVLHGGTRARSDGAYVYAGPSEYIAYNKDNKVANFHLEMEGFMGAPVTLDAQLSVMDSPNSAGVVIDAVRYLKVATEGGVVGALRGPSAFTQKTPPEFMSFHAAQQECDALSQRDFSAVLHKNTSPRYERDYFKVELEHEEDVSVTVSNELL